jgi:hypothetical protein
VFRGMQKVHEKGLRDVNGNDDAHGHGTMRNLQEGRIAKRYDVQL